MEVTLHYYLLVLIHVFVGGLSRYPKVNIYLARIFYQRFYASNIKVTITCYPENFFQIWGKIYKFWTPNEKNVLHERVWIRFHRAPCLELKAKLITLVL